MIAVIFLPAAVDVHAAGYYEERGAGLDRLELATERRDGTTFYSVRGQVETGLRFLGGREFLQAGLTHVTSRRVPDGLMLEVGAGLTWEALIAPYLDIGLLADLGRANDEVEDSNTDDEFRTFAAYGELGLRVELPGPGSLKVAGRRYSFDRAGDDEQFGVITAGLLFEMH